ncbi:MAG: ElyC/SanA/YdcF family protein [Thermosphaera sp.]
MEVIAKYLVLPSNLMTISLLASLVLLLLRMTKRGLWVGVGGVVVYLVFGAGPVSFLLLGALEFRIPPADLTEREKAEAMVVLAGYGEADPDHPLSSSVNGTSAIRLLETVMSYRSRPTTVFVSGFGDVARIMRDILVSAGIPAEQVIVDSVSRHTHESAEQLAPLLGDKPFLLITSAGHMPRAMGVFLKAGTRPLPVPTDYMTKRNVLATNYLPSPLHLYYSDLAMSEYAALAWYHLKGRL